MAQNKNTFIKGMDQDTSKQKYQPENYVAARNFRPLTSDGLSSGAMENIKGTNLQHNFPEIKGFLELDFNGAAYKIVEDDNGIQVPQTATVNLQFVQPGVVPYPSQTIINTTFTFTSPKDYLDQLVELLNDYNQGLPNNAKLVIYRKATYDRLIIRSPLYGIVNLGNDGFMTSVARGTMKDFMVLGSTNLRDKNIIFTISQPDYPNTVLAEGDTAPGQIWQMVYDPEHPNDAKELKLLYYGDLRFSLNHPIEAVANYENDETQMVYWTDNYNPPRKINIVDPDIFILREDDLLLSNKARLTPAIPTTEDQIGGTLPTGLFYITYKLQRFGGSTTGIAPWSNAIPVNADTVPPPGNDTNYEFINYAQDTVGTTKVLNYLIPDLPRGYDKIFVYAVYEKSPKEYFVYLIEENLLDDSPLYRIKLASIGDKRKLNITQLLEFDVDFETVKTMAIKDSHLMFGNVKLAAFDLDWDARSYRFKQGTTDSYVNIPGTNVKNWGIPLTDDCVNPHNDDRTAEIDDYRYVRNSSILGGSGPNITYAFTWKDVVLDQSSRANPSNQDANQGDLGGDLPERSPFINVPAKGTIETNVGGRTDSETQVDIGPGFTNFKNNRYESYFKGYQRDEVYRFGIVFYSLTGKPSEVKWIGDIRFPSDGDLPADARMCRYHSSIDTSGGVGVYDIPLADGLDEREASIGASLGIKFDVDVSKIASKISGYSIVRAPRYERDRTIIAQGAYGEVRSINTYNPKSGKDDTVFYNYTRIGDTDSSKYGDTQWQYGTLDCPDLKFNSGARVFDYVGLRSDIEDNYYLKPVAGYVNINEPSAAAYPDVNINTPNMVGGEWGPDSPKFTYTKSLLRISQATWASRLEFTKEKSGTNLKGRGKLDALVKVGANAAVTLGGDTFSNRGFVTNKIDYVQPEYINIPNAVPTIKNKNTLASPGCQTVLVRGTDSKLGAYLLNTSFGKGGSKIDDEPYEDNKIGNFGTGATSVPKMGQTAIVDIYRFPKDQYGGNTYLARQNTKYISTGHFCPVYPSDTRIENSVFGGDVYISAFGEKKLYGQVPRDANTLINNIPQRVKTAYMGPLKGRIYPVSTVTNPEMRVGFHFNNYLTGAGGDIDLREEAQDDYLLPFLYHREKDLQTYFVEGSGNNLVATYDNRVYLSNPKINGERADSWSVVKPLNKRDVDGLYGPINKLMTLNQMVVFFQDRAFGVLDINPTAVIPSVENDNAIQLGTGKGITNARYISNTIGCFHQWAITKSRTAIYWFDAVHKKLLRFNGSSPEVLSDIKSMSSWFHNKVRGSVITNDNPLLYNGIACTYDFRFNEVIFTYHSDISIPTYIYSLIEQSNEYMQDQLIADAEIMDYTDANITGGKDSTTSQGAKDLSDILKKLEEEAKKQTELAKDYFEKEEIKNKLEEAIAKAMEEQRSYTALSEEILNKQKALEEFTGSLSNANISLVSNIEQYKSNPGGYQEYKEVKAASQLKSGAEEAAKLEKSLIERKLPIDRRQEAAPKTRATVEQVKTTTNVFSNREELDKAVKSNEAKQAELDKLFKQNEEAKRAKAKEIEALKEKYEKAKAELEKDSVAIKNAKDRVIGEDFCGRPVYKAYTDYKKQESIVIPQNATGSKMCYSIGGHWNKDNMLCYVSESDAKAPPCISVVGDPEELNPIRVEESIPTVIAFYPSQENRWYETIVFNENINAFSSFYDHFPTHYINDGRRFFSQNPQNDLDIYIHDEGERTTFYGEYFPATMMLIVNPKGDHTKVFTNVEVFTIVTNAVTFDDRYNQTFSLINYFNEYQDTGDIDLIPDSNIRRRMRTWRSTIPRDLSGSNARIRNPYMEMYMEYDRLDSEDKRIVVHDITTHYMDVPM